MFNEPIEVTECKRGSAKSRWKACWRGNHTPPLAYDKPKDLFKFPSACDCDSHGSRITNPSNRFPFDEPMKQSGSECPSDVRNTLAPIETRVGKAAPGAIGDFQIDTD